MEKKLACSRDNIREVGNIRGKYSEKKEKNWFQSKNGINQCSILLVFLLALTHSMSLCQAQVFLRHLDAAADDEGMEDRGWRTRRAVPSTAPSWRARIRRKAASFGQSVDEAQRVKNYLERINEIAAEKHSFTKETTRSLAENYEINRQLKSWTNNRMLDQNSRSIKAAINPEENGKFFEGDIILSGDQAEQMYEFARDAKNRRRTKRKFIGSSVRRWDTSKPIIYSFDGSHTLREQKVIELALEHWHNITCLNFERRDDEPKGSRIVFTDVDGCASNVGKHPLGEPQFVSLAPECIRLGVIAHEVAHALGFWHEQSRPDRDFFVRIRWENIDRDSKGQFLKEQPADVDNGDVVYDYGSIMHYRSKAFAKYDDLFTMSTFISDYQRTIGQRDQLSFNDIQLMNRIYCRNTCPRKLPCQRGGYTDPRHCDRCRCPDGFTGKLCDEVMPGYGTKCGGRVQLTDDPSVWTKIHSPDYPNEFREGQECSWLITAPRGQFVQLQADCFEPNLNWRQFKFVSKHPIGVISNSTQNIRPYTCEIRFIGEFEMYCKVRHSLCMDYVEIRNSTDFANTGMRYCCYGTPSGSVVSATEDMLVLFRSFYRGGKGFQAQMRAIPRTGQWSEWNEVAPCSASCGACGVSQRRRQCQPPNAYCIGKDTETETCNIKPCSGMCTRKRIEDTNCTGFLSLLKGIRCKTERTRLEPCNEICCAGFTMIDGICTR